MRVYGHVYACLRMFLFPLEKQGWLPSLAGGKVMTPATTGGGGEGAAKPDTFSEPFRRFIFLSAFAGGWQ